MTIVFSTIALWYSGFLPYQNELVKTNDQTADLDVCIVYHIVLFLRILISRIQLINPIYFKRKHHNKDE
jgi:hypothetical protein